MKFSHVENTFRTRENRILQGKKKKEAAQNGCIYPVTFDLHKPNMVDAQQHTGANASVKYEALALTGC